MEQFDEREEVSTFTAWREDVALSLRREIYLGLLLIGMAAFGLVIV